jgi:hypothetical protein
MCALREAYIYKNEGVVQAVGSTLDILKYISDLPETNETDFYNSTLFKSRYVWVGDKTSCAAVTRLKPNHCLNIGRGEVKRFFPTERLEEKSMQATVEEVSIVLPGILKAVVSRSEKIMIGLTAGWDSRLLLAASRAVSSKLVFFVNVYSGSSAYDHRIPMKLAKKLDLTFITVHLGLKNKSQLNASDFPRRIKQEITKIAEFKKIFFAFKSISGSISEVARNEFGVIREVDGMKLSQLAKFGAHPYCVAEFDAWLHLNKEVFLRYGYNVLDMFYWEEVVANRIGKSTTECHALQHTILPVFNCRYLINLLLRVNIRYRDKQNHMLYRELIHSMWPEVLSEPINPGFKKRTIQLMQKIRLYNIYRNIFSAGVLTAVRKGFVKDGRLKY